MTECVRSPRSGGVTAHARYRARQGRKMKCLPALSSRAEDDVWTRIVFNLWRGERGMGWSKGK